MTNRKTVKFACTIVGGAACAITVGGLPALAADHGAPANQACAVSTLNGKLEGAGGFIDQRGNDGGRGHALISLAAPLGCMYGFQVDGGIGDLAGSTAGGLAGHIFARDPSRYLYGGYAQWGSVGGQDIWRIGAEAEFYRGNMTFEVLGGFEDTDRTKSDIFAALDVAFYSTENLRISAGYRRFVKVDAAGFGVEWQPEELNLGVPVSFFLNGGVGSKSYATLYGGVRFHFGAANKSLIRRHREDDPGAKGIFELQREDFSNVDTVTSGTGGDSKVQ